MVLWAVAIVGVLVGCAAWARAGRTARKLEALNQSYWELRYDFTRLRSQVARLDPETEAAQAEASPAQAPGQVAFVSLSSMKKKG
jgi:outer membrane murein-binding lipoprotein Lpp